LLAASCFTERRFGASNQEAPMAEQTLGFVTTREDGRKLRNPAGGELRFTARGEQTGGSLTSFESSAAPGEGPPLHVHANEDEVLYVIEGRLRFILGTRVEEAPAGSLVFIPRGVEHTWQNVGDVPARFLVLFTPAATGMEQFFERAAELPDDVGVAEVFKQLGADAGMEVLGPPMARASPR
jgi:quercetin dioxygenase-like cupin family protein